MTSSGSGSAERNGEETKQRFGCKMEKVVNPTRSAKRNRHGLGLAGRSETQKEHKNNKTGKTIRKVGEIMVFVVFYKNFEKKQKKKINFARIFLKICKSFAKIFVSISIRSGVDYGCK